MDVVKSEMLFFLSSIVIKILSLNLCSCCSFYQKICTDVDANSNKGRISLLSLYKDWEILEA